MILETKRRETAGRTHLSDGTVTNNHALDCLHFVLKEYYRTGGSAIILDGGEKAVERPGDNTTARVSQPIMANAEYGVRGRYIIQRALLICIKHDY